ncbi:hypothetical protein N658DRAFT_520262 [Parathielavia hyrcaniae]|uniref:Uncharacterized protein n=1 Tax=Parathielavia hyrcaniae TaxID=113614 RepID=A0AAN6QAT5_9PEZI|nr:hypothetical protein N658DRAFT_520262 [Parathielavia hyrcaniae]
MADDARPTSSEPRLPRVTIQFCTQCKWMLRAAYYAQELLSTFSVTLGEVALQPATGGVFVVEITSTDTDTTASSTTTNANANANADDRGSLQPKRVVLWDRKVDGGFPETKELKRRVRDVIEPGRNLGHVDRDYGLGKSGGGGTGVPGAEGVKKSEGTGQEGKAKACSVEGGEKCEDCE